MFADIALYPEQASTTATHVDWLFAFLTGVTGSVGLLVAVLLIYFSVRYRRRAGETGVPAETHFQPALEWFWKVTPLGIFLVMFTWGATIYIGAYRTQDDDTPIYEEAKQWMWKIQHLERKRTIN